MILSFGVAFKLSKIPENFLLPQGSKMMLSTFIFISFEYLLILIFDMDKF
jgi:hypothetical protein